MGIEDIISSLLAGKRKNEIAALMCISPRQFNRRYRDVFRQLLTKERYLELVASGYRDVQIAKAHFYTRQRIWQLKKQWGFPVMSRVKVNPQMGCGERRPDVETKWGTAQWVQGYYRIAITNDHAYGDHPLRTAGAGHILLHRLVCLEHLISIGNFDKLEEADGYWTLPYNSSIHHIDGDRGNNAPENLMLLSRKGHARRHWHNEKAGLLIERNSEEA